MGCVKYSILDFVVWLFLKAVVLTETCIEMVSMLNQAAIDALCSAAYLESYLDCVDDLPNDLQRTVTMLRELDCVTNGTGYIDSYMFCASSCLVKDENDKFR